MQKQKILIFKIGAIGDVLMTTPFIKQLGESKKFEIDYMCGNGVAQILVGNEYIKNVINFDEKFFQKITIKNLFSYLKFLVFLFKKRKNYDYVVILDKHKVFNFTFFIAGFKNRYGFNRLGKEGKFLNKTIYWNKTKREVEYYLDFLELFGIKFDYKKQRYDFFGGIIDKLNKNKKLTEKEKSLIGRYLSKKQEIDKFIKQFTGKKIIGIATGGGNLLVPKNDCRGWNLENWKKLTIELLEKGNTVLLLGSKSDRNLNINNLNFYNLLGKYSIHEIIYLTSKIDLVISQEAGFIHFVGCINTKLLTIAGPTNPYRFHPYNDNGEKIKIGWIWKEEFECYDEYGSFDKCRGDEINKISVKEVLEKI